MIRFGPVWDIAKAEMRLTRRLARFWVFQVLAFLFAALFFVQYNFIHAFGSPFSGSAALINPRFLLHFVGMWYLVLFLVGIVFLGFEIRARDKREKIVEVFDALPVNNLELILGRFLGILIACWVPALITLILFSLIGLLGFQSMPLPSSIVTFLFVMVPPAYALILAMTFFLTFVLKHRLLAGVVIAALVIGLTVVNFGFSPIWLLPGLDITGAFMVPPMTEFSHSPIDLRSAAQRVGILAFAIGFLFLSALIHPRRDELKRGTLAALAAASFVVGGALLGALVLEGRAILADLDRWRAAHEARVDEPHPDVTRLAGSVDLSRKTRFDLDLQLDVSAPRDASLDSLLFTLNPGFEVESVTTADGRALSFTHEHALLEIALDRPLAAGEATTVALRAGGPLDYNYGYLDADVQPLGVSMQEGNLFILGFMNSLVQRGVVALMPGSRWLPMSGPDVRRGGGGLAIDFYEVDLTVTAPSGWLVAGPARRQDAGEDTFRFATTAPVPDVALVAAPYVSHAMEIDGVTLELLVHPKHQRNIEVLAEGKDAIREWIAGRMEQAAEVGLDYPYDALTMVEVPNHLRGYAGGWRLDTTLAQPALILTREIGFPTARFDRRFEDTTRFEDRDDGVAGQMRDDLVRFFENDFTGGNPFLAASRSYFTYQTQARGEAALPLDFVHEDLTNQLVADNRAYFSAHMMTSQSEMNNVTNQVMMSMTRQDGGPARRRSASDIVIENVTSRSDVWSTALETSLDDLDPWEAPKRTLNVLTLKGGAMAQALIDGLGSERAGALLATLRERSGGGGYDAATVIAVGEEIGVDLQAWMDRWLHDTALPGFREVGTTLERIADDEDGSPNYQLLVRVHNGEDVPGMIKLTYLVPAPGGRPGGGGGRGRRNMEETDPIEVPAHGTVEIGIVTSQVPRFAFLSPYLSLNRDGWAVDLPQVDEEAISDAEPFVGTRVIDWEPEEDGSIVVDDLDEGFDVLEGERSGLRLAGRGISGEDTDGGLPVARGRTPSRWSRREAGLAYGRYRHTMATIKAGDGDRVATFTAEIPTSGAWELEYHMPTFRRQGGGDGDRRRNRFGNPGVWTLEVVGPTGTREVRFDAAEADPNWNLVDTFELAAGEVTVRVPNRADEDGRYVIADAIRWRPARRGPTGAASADGGDAE